ncbi:ribosome maturation factor RimM [Massilia sp. erpn]|nr:ribosome maturation factor RimM [Massilia sp. erpn]
MTGKTASGVQIPDDLVQVGFVSGAYGVVGGIKVRPFSEDADALLHVETWWLDKPGGLHDVDVKRAKFHSGDVVAQLVGVVDRNVAESLKGASVFIPRSLFPTLQEDEFYWSDLIGLDVENLQGERLGQVTDMMSNGPQSILRITGPAAAVAEGEAQERLIPFVEQFVITVDKDAKKIVVDWGLDY